MGIRVTQKGISDLYEWRGRWKHVYRMQADESGAAYGKLEE